LGKGLHSFPHIKEQLEETKAARKHVKIHWIPAHGWITGNETADEVAKHSIRHGRDSQISIPAEDMKSVWRKNPNPAVAPEGGMSQGTAVLYIVP
jgi:hypothetical protein